MLANGQELAQQQARTTTDLQQPFRPQRGDPFDRGRIRRLGGHRLTVRFVEEALTFPYVLLAQPRIAWRRASAPRNGSHDVSEHAQVATCAFADCDAHLIHCRVLGQRGLDLAWFDPEAAQLHLVVDAAEELDIPVRQVPGAVASPVQARAVTTERVRHEPLSGEPRSAEIAPGHTGTADIYLAGHAGGHQPQPRIQQVELRVGDRPADRRRRDHLVGAPEVRHVHRGLRGSEDVEHFPPRRPAVHHGGHDHFATKENRRQLRQFRLRQRRKHRRHECDLRNLARGQHLC